MELDRLKTFRQAAYQHLGKAHDATFELTDAVLLTRTAYSLADLSLPPEGVTRELGARADNGLGPYTSLIKTAFMGGFTG